MPDRGPSWEDAQLAPARPQLSRTQRQGLRWGAAAGFLTGLAIGAILLSEHECEGMGCLASPGVAAVMYLGILPAASGVAGAGVGLVVGTIVDDDRPRRAYVGFEVGIGALR